LTSRGADPRRVLFAFYERADFGVAHRVMRALADRGVKAVFLSGFDYKERTGEVPPLVVPPGVESRAVGDYYPAEPVSVDEELARLRAQVRAEEGLAARLFDRLLGRAYVPELLAECGRVAAALRAYVRAERPHLVVLPEDTDYIRGRLAAHILESEGTPCAVMTPNYYAMFSDYPLIGKGLAQPYLVAHEGQAARLRARGVSDERIRIVGSPTFDDLARVPSGGGSGVLFVLQGLPADESIAKQLLSIARRLGKVLYLKAHPDVPAPWMAQLRSENGWSEIPDREPVRPWLSRVETVVGVSTTVLYEALLVGRGVVVIHLSGLPPPVHLPPGVEGALATSWREVEQLLTKGGVALSVANVPMAFPHHPRAAEAAAEAVLAALK
jgi:hypothetical protein